jgi:hypothetical protein
MDINVLHANVERVYLSLAKTLSRGVFRILLHVKGIRAETKEDVYSLR